MVFAFDLRNHGTSPHTDTMTLPGDGRGRRRRRSTALGVGPVALVGHSMGGKTAMLTALQHPEVVDRLVVVDVAPVAYPPAFVEYARAMRDADLTSVQRRADVDDQLVDAVPEAGHPGLPAAEPDPRRRRARAGGPNLPVIEAALPDHLRLARRRDRLATTGPTLFVYGGKSDYVQHEHHATIEPTSRTGQFAEIPEAGHWVHAERLDDFLAAVTPFLDA